MVGMGKKKVQNGICISTRDRSRHRPYSMNCRLLMFVSTRIYTEYLTWYDTYYNIVVPGTYHGISAHHHSSPPFQSSNETRGKRQDMTLAGDATMPKQPDFGWSSLVCRLLWRKAPREAADVRAWELTAVDAIRVPVYDTMLYDRIQHLGATLRILKM